MSGESLTIGCKLHTVPLVAIVVLTTAAALWSVTTMSGNERLAGDAGSYDRLAAGMLHGSGYASVTRPPVYPSFVAAVHAVAGRSPVAVAVAQAVLCVLTLLLSYRIFLYVCRDGTIALVAMAACAVWPPFYKQIPILLTEGLSCFLAAVTIWSVICAAEKPIARNSITAGVMITVLTLTKAVTIPYMLLAPLALVLGRSNQLRQRKRMVMVMFAASVLALAPWTYRNYRVTERFLPVTTLSGFNFWYGNSPEAYLYADQADWFRQCGETVVINTVDSGAVDRDRAWMKKGMALVKEHPMITLGLFARKFSGLWLGTLGCISSSCDTKIPHIGSFGIPKMAFLQVPLFLLALLGWFALDKPARVSSYPIVLLALVWTGVYVALWGERRYMVPMTYYEILFAATAIVEIVRRRSHRQNNGNELEDR